MTSRPCVLVTGVGGRSVGHQILHALSLVAEKYKIVAADMDRFSFGLYQTPYRYVVPPPTSPDYLPAILRIIEREGVGIILPGSEPEIRVLAHSRAALAGAGCKLVSSPPEVIDVASDKWIMQGWLEKCGFGVPRTASGTDWKQFVREVGFPVVGKPTALSGGSRSVAILQDETEVARYLDDVQLSPEAIIFQEYVGDADSEYTVGVLVSLTGVIIDSIAIHRKLTGLSLGAMRNINGRKYGISTGYSQGFVEKHGPMQTYCEGLAQKLGARGPLNIQCRMAQGEIKVFEVHPRFSGTTSIRADVGFNEADVMVRHYLFGEEFGRLDYRTDVAVIRAFQTAVVPRSELDGTPSA